MSKKTLSFCLRVAKHCPNFFCIFLFLLRSLYADDESRPPLLQPPEDSIVPLEVKKTPSVVNTHFRMSQANTRKIYIKDFAYHLQSMLDDSGYKFSEEYEVCTYVQLMMRYSSFLTKDPVLVLLLLVLN